MTKLPEERIRLAGSHQNADDFPDLPTSGASEASHGDIMTDLV